MRFKRTTLSIILAVLLIAILILVIGLRYHSKPAEEKSNTVLKLEGISITVEIADTPDKQETGLMYRKFLGENNGMLFKFNTSDIQSFWMRNTLIPLDMLWINSDKKIVYIQENAQPCLVQLCDVYTPTEKAQYVLELNGGWVEKNKVKVGDSVDF